MSNNYGKAFESKFLDDWKKSFPKSFYLRLYDTTNGFLGVANPCDYICFTNRKLFMIECKSHSGQSIPFSVIPQYERLLRYKNYENVYPGILVWYIDKDNIFWYPIEELEKIYNRGYKSLNPDKLLKENFKIIKIPANKKRVFMEADYSILSELEKED